MVYCSIQLKTMALLILNTTIITNKENTTADDYVSFISTHADHITLQEPYKSKIYTSIRDTILSFGNKIILYDTIVLYLARKP